MPESSNDSLSPPTAETPSSTPPTPAPWRAGDNAPAWARGKSPDEILNIAGSAVETLEKFNQAGKVLQQQAPPPYQPPPYQPPAAPSAPPLDPTDFVTGAQMQQFIAQQAQSQLQPALQGMYENQAQTNLRWIQEKHTAEFQKYGPEIHGLVAQLPAHVRSLDNLQIIVDTVRGRHWREMARDHAAEIFANDPPTMRSNSGAGPGGSPPQSIPSVQADDLPEYWRTQAQQVGLTDATVEEFCRSNNMTKPQFFDMVKKRGVVGSDRPNLTDVRDGDGKKRGMEMNSGG